MTCSDYVMLYYIMLYDLMLYSIMTRTRGSEQALAGRDMSHSGNLSEALRPVHLLRVFLLRVLESNFPGDPLYNYTDRRVPTP